MEHTVVSQQEEPAGSCRAHSDGERSALEPSIEQALVGEDFHVVRDDWY